MGRFTRGQREQLNALLRGAGGRKNSKEREARLTRALLATVSQAVIRAVPSSGTVPLRMLEKAVGNQWLKLSDEHRKFLVDELARRGFTESGKRALTDLCIAELKKRGQEVPQISETARKLVDKILDEGGLTGSGSVYELVVEKIDTGSWQQAGLLKLLGYKVGNDGLHINQRRKILRDAYRVSLVPGSEEVADYLRSWGAPLSEQRLDKITGSISRFMALAQNQKADYSAALADWQADLDWLQRRS